MSTSIVSFMSTIDASIVNIAVPKISRDLRIPNNQAEWIVSVYLVLICVLLILFGELSDQVGRVRLFQIGTVIFVLGSLACGLSINLPTILAARVLQALGASMTMATNFGIITDIFPLSRHGLALGVNSAFVQIGNIAGPGVGGLILSIASWHDIFFVNVPIGIVAFFLGHHFFPHPKPLRTRPKIDIWGFLAYTGLILSFFVMIFLGQMIGFGHWKIIGLAILAGGFLIGFILIERQQAEPLIDLRLFHNLGFTFGILSAMLVYMCGYFNNVIMPFYLQDRLLLSSGLSGLILMAVPIVNVFSAPTGGAISDHLGAEKVSFMALFIFLVPEVIFILVTPSWSIIWLIIGLALFGCANGAFQNNPMIMGNAAPEFQGIAGSIAALGRNLGMSMGLALATSLLYHGISLKAGQRMTTYPDQHPDWFVFGMHYAYMFSLGLILIAIVLIGIVLKRQTRRIS
nr:MFS transporter [Lentilactobacillus raoultii]